MSKRKVLIDQTSGWRILAGVAAGLIFLSACQARVTPEAPPPAPSPTEALPTQTPVPTIPPQINLGLLLPQPTQPTKTGPTATQDALDASAAQEVVETYYHLLEEKKYAAAYALLSPSKPNLKPLDEWVADREMMLNALELISIQPYPASLSTQIAEGVFERTPPPFYESDHCKVFVIREDVDYVGGWGAEPSGIDSKFVVVIKEEGEWQIRDFASGITRDICHQYH